LHAKVQGFFRFMEPSLLVRKENGKCLRGEASQAWLLASPYGHHQGNPSLSAKTGLARKSAGLLVSQRQIATRRRVLLKTKKERTL